MAGTPEIRATKAGLEVISFPSVDMHVTKVGVEVLGNKKTQFIQINKAGFDVVAKVSTTMQINKAGLEVICRGRVAKPNVLMWTATLDGHDYVLIQTFAETLVYDFHSKQWSSWGTSVSGNWRAQLGRNWNADIAPVSAGLGAENMSNIVAGDDDSDTLYFLEPEFAMDDNFEGTGRGAFTRVITGQLTCRGHDFISCPAVELTCSNGDPLVGTDLTVDLKVSDDRGYSYWSAGTLEVQPGVHNVTLAWRSLGSFTGPGRLFRFVDNGAVYRVDGMDIPDGK